MAEKLEIERKFLLKAMPSKRPTEIVKINQFYLKNSDDVWERARSWDSNINGKSWIHTIKTSISEGIDMENENPMTEKEFEDFKALCISKKFESKYVYKKRWIYPHPYSDLKWEVDKFGSGLTLIVAEIEIPEKDYEVVLPGFIKNRLLMEVTAMKNFSSRSLSRKIVNWKEPVKKVKVKAKVKK